MCGLNPKQQLSPDPESPADTGADNQNHGECFAVPRLSNWWESIQRTLRRDPIPVLPPPMPSGFDINRPTGGREALDAAKEQVRIPEIWEALDLQGNQHSPVAHPSGKTTGRHSASLLMVVGGRITAPESQGTPLTFCQKPLAVRRDRRSGACSISPNSGTSPRAHWVRSHHGRGRWNE